MNIETKLEVLKKVAKILNHNNVTWAVGASLLLYLKGITNNFRDIDLVVAESDVTMVKCLFDEIGILQQGESDVQYKSKTFLEYVIDKVDFDIIAGFVIVKDNIDYYFPLEKKDIKDSIKLDGIHIPLQSIDEWKKYYTLMGRVDKVKMIEQK